MQISSTFFIFSFGYPNEANLLAILFPIKSPVASAIFWDSFFTPYSCFCCSIHYFFTIFISKFSSKWQKAVSFNEFSKFRFCWISHFYKSYPIIIAKLTLYSISSVLLTWPVNQTSTKKKFSIDCVRHH